MRHAVGDLAQDLATGTCPCHASTAGRPPPRSLPKAAASASGKAPQARCPVSTRLTSTARQLEALLAIPDPTKLLCILEAKTLSLYPTKLPQLFRSQETQQTCGDVRRRRWPAAMAAAPGTAAQARCARAAARSRSGAPARGTPRAAPRCAAPRSPRRTRAGPPRSAARAWPATRERRNGPVAKG